MKSTKNTLRFGALLTAATLTLAACGSDPVEVDTDGGEEVEASGSVLDEIDQAEIDRIREMLPAEYADAGATWLAGRRHHVDLDLDGGVAHAGVAEVAVAGFAHRACVDVHPGLQGHRQGVHQGALHLGFEAPGVDRPADVHGGDRLGDPGCGGIPGVDLDQVGDRALVLLVEPEALGGAGRHRPAPRPGGGHLVEDGSQPA